MSLVLYIFSQFYQ